ncbi:hypothetical protein SK128_020483, partial [Halocaridina rubra]
RGWFYRFPLLFSYRLSHVLAATTSIASHPNSPWLTTLAATTLVACLLSPYTDSPDSSVPTSFHL